MNYKVHEVGGWSRSVVVRRVCEGEEGLWRGAPPPAGRRGAIMLCCGLRLRPTAYLPASHWIMSFLPTMTSTLLCRRLKTFSCAYGTLYFSQSAFTLGCAFWYESTH